MRLSVIYMGVTRKDWKKEGSYLDHVRATYFYIMRYSQDPFSGHPGHESGASFPYLHDPILGAFTPEAPLAFSKPF